LEEPQPAKRRTAASRTPMERKTKAMAEEQIRKR